MPVRSPAESFPQSSSDLGNHATPVRAKFKDPYHPLTRDQIPQAVRALHPLWQTTDPGTLQVLDARFARGSLRRWILLTHHTRRALAATGAGEPDLPLLHSVVNRIDTGRRP